MARAACGVELFAGGRWRLVGRIVVDDDARGYEGSGRFEYDWDWVDDHTKDLGATDARAVSCRYPIAFEVREEARWPAFVLDLLPSGAARGYWERRLGLPNGFGSDWQVLTRGGGNPPGNVRIAEAAAADGGPVDHAGFSRAEVIEKNDSFLEHAREHGAPVAGGSGAGGDSPKWLLREDLRGRWHADGALADERTKRAWLVKFPRSSRADDELVLRAEAGYLEVARSFGIRAGEALVWEKRCLFVPRFDRLTKGGKVDRLALESLCSLAGVTEYGAETAMPTLAGALATYSTDAAHDLEELVVRDVLNVALGNTDNHARNTAVLKDARGSVTLSPLYDFAPMFLDSKGIARVCRWPKEEQGFPDWNAVVDAVAAVGARPEAVRARLRALLPKVRALPRSMEAARVPAKVIERCATRIERVAEALGKVKKA